MNIIPSPRPAPRTEKANSVLVVNFDAVPKDALLDALRSALPGIVVETAGTLADALDQAANATVVVVMEASAKSLARAWTSDQGSHEAFESWKARRSDLLAAQRRNRRRITLVDAAVLSTGGEGLENLASRLGVEVGEPDQGVGVQDAAPGRYVLGAVVAIAGSPEAARLIGELEAATIGSSQGPALSETLAEVDSWRREATEIALLRETLQLQIDQQRLQETAKLDAEQALVKANARQKTLGEEIEALRTQLAKETSTRQGVEARVSELQTLIDLLRENLALNLESIGQIQTKAAAELAAVSKAAERDLQLERAKTTATDGKLRAARAREEHRAPILGAEILRRSQLVVALQAEGHHLRRQLETAIAESSDLSRQLALTSGERDKLGAEAAALSDRVTSLGRELETVYASRSWRVTGPLRAARARSSKPRA